MDTFTMPFAPAPPMADLGIPELSVEAIQEMLGIAKQTFEPKLRPGWKQPKRPKPHEITAAANRQEQVNRARIDRQMDVLARLRFAKTGIFDQDREAVLLGDMDSWTSTALVDDWNLVSAALSLIPISYVKQTLDQQDRHEAQVIEDFAAFVRGETVARWAERPDQILEVAEAKVLTAYGQIVSRNLVDLEDEECPIDSTLVDPATVFAVPAGRKGLRCVFRRYRTTLGEAMADWGEPDRDGIKALRDQKGGEKALDEGNVVTVTEYWDAWWRSVTVGDGVELLKVTAHEYGFVPWVVKLAPGGEPLFTDTGLAGQRRDEMNGYRSGPTDDFGLEHKGLGIVDNQRIRHDQYEALNTLLLAGLRKGIDPAYLLKRTINSAAEDLPLVDRRPGGVTELFEGESLDVLPTGTPAGELQVLMNAVNTDRMSGSSPMAAFGNIDGSNISGVARSGAAEQGQDKIAPLVKTLEAYHAQNATMWVRQFRNQGHLVRFKDGERKAFAVPSSYRSVGEGTLREVTPEIVDRVGDRILVKMNRVRVQDMVPLASAAKQFHDLGVVSLEYVADLLGITDFHRMHAQNLADKAEMQRTSLPEFAKIVDIPQDLMRRIRESDDELEREFLAISLEKWEELISAPQEAQLAPPPAPPMGQPGMTPPASPGTPGTSAGVSYAALGQGPGTVTGQQGGPTGPYAATPQPLGPQSGVPYGAP